LQKSHKKQAKDHTIVPMMELEEDEVFGNDAKAVIFSDTFTAHTSTRITRDNDISHLESVLKNEAGFQVSKCDNNECREDLVNKLLIGSWPYNILLVVGLFDHENDDKSWDDIETQLFNFCDEVITPLCVSPAFEKAQKMFVLHSSSTKCMDEQDVLDRLVDKILEFYDDRAVHNLSISFSSCNSGSTLTGHFYIRHLLDAFQQNGRQIIDLVQLSDCVTDKLSTSYGITNKSSCCLYLTDGVPLSAEYLTKVTQLFIVFHTL
jgi:hypothetical protein